MMLQTDKSPSKDSRSVPHRPSPLNNRSFKDLIVIVPWETFKKPKVENGLSWQDV